MQTSPLEVSTYVDGFHNVEAVKKLSYSRLGNTDIVVSHIGIGGCSAGGVYGDVGDQRSIDTIVEALRSGINYIDTSPYYGGGKSEEVIGKALKLVPRKSYFLATKVGRYGQDWCNMFDFSAERTEQSVATSLERLGVDCIDLIQVHDLEFGHDIQQILRETLPTLQKMVRQGKARYIGLTSYSLTLLRQVVEQSTVHIDAVLSYCRATLLDQELGKYRDFFQSRGVGIINASITGMSLLTSAGPQCWHPASGQMKLVAQQAAALCSSRGVELARLAVQYSVATPGVAVHVLGCNDVTILRLNIDASTSPQTDLEKELVEEVQKLFLQLPQRHWEGVEIEKMKKAMEEVATGH